MKRLRAIAERIGLVAVICLGGCSESDSRAAHPSGEWLAEQVREAFAQRGYLARASNLAPHLHRLAPQNVAEVRAVYDEYMPALSESELQLFMDAWAGFDGAAALEYAMGIPFTRQAGVARQAAVQSWAIRDPLSASRAVSELIEQKPRMAKELPLALVAGWALAPRGGVEESLLSVPERSDLIGVAVGGIYRRDGPERTLQMG